VAVASDLPELENRAQFEHAQNSVVYDVNHQKIATLTNNQGRILVNSADIAPVIKEATVAIEDQRFYDRGSTTRGSAEPSSGHPPPGCHPGCLHDHPAVRQERASRQSSRTVFEKLREALAYQLERHWDKDKILTEYLNEITSARAPTASRRRRRPTSAGTTRAAAPHTTVAPHSSFHGRPPCSPA
jgi:penicillin-binding protein 1A